ncbi:putative c-3 sterol dehydrogenase c-4 decarboxylase family protein [Podospora fimiseda]|uniref:C-3 sterol dehydrogenase c-4 decarboxylase family protein n=1 Tax=Podospora fimiseda TaxID=252190 RepID=A0AAN6YTR1_9PEZI|nr:putative c-3 sterol dehydrogenase c-4 decarboxylase family protein [Podospora fimiseda]
MSSSQANPRFSPGPQLGTVIVTGGCGFVGSHLVDALLVLSPKLSIHVFDINTTRNRVDHSTFPDVIYHQVDVSDRAAIFSLFESIKPVTVFHAASPTALDGSSAIFERVTLQGARNMVAASLAVGTVKAFIYTSSSSVVHDNVSDLVGADETWPLLDWPQQKRQYTLMKARAEAEILALNRNNETGMLTTSIRPSTVFGERDYTQLGKIVETIRQGKGKYQMGDGKNLYSFTYVGNTVDGHVLAAQKLLEAHGKPPLADDIKVEGEAFNITNDDDWLFWEYQRTVAALIGLPVKKEDIKVLPVWLALFIASLVGWVTWVVTLGKGKPVMSWDAIRYVTIHRTLKCEKAKKRLGYKPRVGMQEGLARATRWFNENDRK